jgi:hypothetical protein
MIKRAMTVETKQPLSKYRAQTPPIYQYLSVLMANTASYRKCGIQCIDFQGNAMPSRKDDLQLLQGDLKPVQECRTCYEIIDKDGISPPPLGSCCGVH